MVEIDKRFLASVAAASDTHVLTVIATLAGVPGRQDVRRRIDRALAAKGYRLAPSSLVPIEET